MLFLRAAFFLSVLDFLSLLVRKNQINQSDNIDFKKNILTKLQCLTYQLLFLQSFTEISTIIKNRIRKKNREIAAGMPAPQK